MGKKKSGSGALGWLVALCVVAVGGYAYFHFQQNAPTKATTPVATTKSTGPAQDASQSQSGSTSTTPSPNPSDATTSQQPSATTGQTGTNSGTSTSDVIQFQGFTGSGSLSLLDRGVKNDMFQIEHLDWSDSNKTLMVVGKMKATNGVAYLRVRDANRDILQPETVVQPQPGAPDWSNITGEIQLDPSYKGKVLDVELYQKADNGMHTNLLKFQIQPQ